VAIVRKYFSFDALEVEIWYRHKYSTRFKMNFLYHHAFRLLCKNEHGKGHTHLTNHHGIFYIKIPWDTTHLSNNYASKQTTIIHKKNVTYVAHYNVRYAKHITLICVKSITKQNLAFLSYWCRKKRLQIHF